MPAAALDGPGSSSTEGDGSSGMGSEGSMTGNGMASEGAGALPLANGNNPGPAAQPSAAQPSAAQPSAAQPSAPSDEAAEETDPTPPPAVEPPPSRLQNILVFTRTTGFRHDSIEAGFQALQRLGSGNGFAVDRTEDPADFNDGNLALYDVVVWLNTDSVVLDDPSRAAFQRYIRAGGGWVGVHAASNTEYNWNWFAQLLGGGAFFRDHPAIQNARVNVEIADHPSTAHLPPSFTVQDEWYTFRANPRASVRVLMTLDESSYGVGDLAMGDHPIAWYHEFEGGRAWYTALGHPIPLYSDTRFTQHLLGGIRWAAGAAP
jgi:cytochrome c